MQKQLIAYVLFFLLGCSVTNEKNIVSVSPGIWFQLSSTIAPPERGMDTVLLEVTQPESSRQVLVRREVKKGRMVMVALSLQGLPLFELEQDSRGNIRTKRYLPIDIAPEYILLDMQLIHQPLQAIKQQLVGADVVENKNEKGMIRQILKEDELVVEIKYLEKNITFNHLVRGYQLTLTKVEQ
ncbi:DUF3261 domain-containing protein [Thalassotalea ganghwensis]